MNGFSALFKLAMKKRIRDSFFITYGIVFPLLIILILGYMTSKFYSGESGITSYYYYTIVIIPFCTFLQAVTLIYISREESNSKCGGRFVVAPIDKLSVVISKIIPSTVTIGIYNLLLLVLCRLVLGVDFKGRMLELFTLYFSLGFMTCAIGTFIGFSIKDFMSVKNLVSTPILIMAMLGGAFFPIGSLGKVINIVSMISPLTWINRGSFQLLNDNNITIFTVAIAITFVLGIFFTIYSVKKFRKEALL